MVGQPRQAPSANRRRHLRTVIRVDPSSAATRATPDPGSAHALVRLCEGTRHRDRAIKNDGGAVRYCPACTPRPWTGHWSPITGDLIPRTYPNPARRR